MPGVESSTLGPGFPLLRDPSGLAQKAGVQGERTPQIRSCRCFWGSEGAHTSASEKPERASRGVIAPRGGPTFCSCHAATIPQETTDAHSQEPGHSFSCKQAPKPPGESWGCSATSLEGDTPRGGKQWEPRAKRSGPLTAERLGPGIEMTFGTNLQRTQVKPTVVAMVTREAGIALGECEAVGVEEGVYNPFLFLK